jgi:hypothetical protein
VFVVVVIVVLVVVLAAVVIMGALESPHGGSEGVAYRGPPSTAHP